MQNSFKNIKRLKNKTALKYLCKFTPTICFSTAGIKRSICISAVACYEYMIYIRAIEECASHNIPVNLEDSRLPADCYFAQLSIAN